jgi:uncharacterized protein YjbI with pentapeptide repeats
VSDDSSFSEVEILSAQLTGTQAQSLQLEKSRLVKVNLAESHLPRFHVSGVEFQDCNLSNLKAPDCSIRRSVFAQNKMTGLHTAGGTFGDTEFANCVMDFAMFDRVRFKQVTFSNCQMRDVDFSDTTFDRVLFIDCDLARATFARLRVAESEMRHCTLTGVRGIGQLSGIAMEWNDLLAHADLFAAGLGIQIATGPGEADD